MSTFTFTAKWPDAPPLTITGIETGTIELNLDGTDTATLVGAAAHLADITVGAEITIAYHSTVILVGTLISNELLQHAGTDRDRSLKVIGHKAWLSRITYCQPWYIITDDGPDEIYSSRLILHAKKVGDTIVPATVDYQLADILAYVATVGAPLQAEASPPIIGITLPIEEQRDLTAAQTIARIARLQPHLITYADYSTTPPTICFRSNIGPAFAPPRTLTHTATQHTRPDLAPAAVIVEVERQHTIAGATYRTLEIQSYGDTTKPNIARVSFQPAGSSFSPNVKILKVETEPVGDYTSEAWWQSYHPALKNIDVADISIVAAQATRGPDPEDYPRISLTPLPDLEAAGLRARLETFTAVADIIRRDSDNAITGIEHAVELELQLITTNATTKTYRWTQGAESLTQEELPEDLAFQLYSMWSTPYHQGTLVTACADGIPTLGQSYRSTHIRSITIDIATQTLTTNYGPPPQLSAADISAYLAAFRGVPPVRRLDSRFDARPPAQIEDDPKVIAPAKNATMRAGTPRRAVYRAATGSANADINPETDLTSGDTAKFRPLTIVTADGTLKEVKALCTEQASPSSPALQEVTVPIDFRVHTDANTLIQRIQVRYGKILVKQIDDAWTDFLVPEPYDL